MLQNRVFPKSAFVAKFFCIKLITWFGYDQLAWAAMLEAQDSPLYVSCVSKCQIKKFAQICFLLKKRKLDENHKCEVKSTGKDGIKRYKQRSL